MKKLLIIASILMLSTIVLIPGIAFADDGNNGVKSESDLGLSSGNVLIIPKIEVQTPDWLIISYGGKVRDKKTVSQQLDAYLVNALAKMRTSSKIEQKQLLGSSSMYDYEQQNWGNSYVSGAFQTYSSWSSSPASFWGSSSSAWYGTYPSSNCDIGVAHTLTPSDMLGYIVSYPSGWDWYYWWTQSPVYTAYNTWYCGTSWNNLTATYPAPPLYVTMMQETENAFDFGDNGPVFWNVDIMDYGY
jgi:hypothetical protein